MVTSSRSTDGAGAEEAPSTPRATDRPGDASPFAVGLLLRRAHDRAAAALVGALRPLGLELRHFAALIELHRSGPLSQRDLGLAIGMDKAMVVRVVDDLEEKGLAIRRAVPGDRRVREVEITTAGVEVFDAAHANGASIRDDLVAHLAPQEYDHLLDLLTRFTYPHLGTRAGATP